MRSLLPMAIFVIICLIVVLPVMAKDNPYKNAHKVTKADISVDIEADTVKLSKSSGVVFDGAGYTHTIGRVSIGMKPLLKGLEGKTAVKGNKRVSGTGHSVQYEVYRDLIKEQVTLKSPDTVSYSYDIKLADWVTTEPDLSRQQVTMDANNTEIVSYPYTDEVTTFARDSTIDINSDEWGNLIVSVNSADIVVIPKPFATDAAGKRFELEYRLDKANRIITLTGDMARAQYPVVIDPSERVTNGGFESGSTDGWTSDSSPAPTLTIVSGGAHEGTYYCLDQGNGIWIGIAGYNRIYQTIDYTGVTSVSMAVKFFNYNRYDYVLSDNFWTGPWNYIIGYPGQQATSWVKKSTMPTLSGEHLIQVWTYGGTTAGIDSISATGAVTPPPPTYSITEVGNPGWGFEDISDSIDLDAHMFSYALESDNKVNWRCIFWDKETSVTKEDLGTSGGGLNNAIFHYHVGHGAKDWIFWGNTYLALSNGQSLHANEVKGMWGKNNKWVWLNSCDILSDQSWNQALSTTHGIFGYTTQSYSGAKEKTDFIELATGRAWQTKTQPLSRAYIKATKDNQPPSVRAAVIFGNVDQYNNDYLPGHGSMAPDKNPNDHSYFYYDWSCEGLEVK